MRLTKQTLAELIKEELRTVTEFLILEQDEEEPADEAAEEEGAEEEAAAEGAEEEAEEEEAEEAAITPQDEVELGKSIDDTLTAVLIDFEAEAVKSAQLEDETIEAIETEVTVEWHKQRLSKLLFEQPLVAELSLDMEKFTSEVARLVLNYQSLLDMEGLIINKAKDFLRSRYDEAHVDEFEELLDIRFGLDIEREEEDFQPPFAAGAGEGGTGA